MADYTNEELALICPGLNLVYVHLNRLIRHSGADILFIAGPERFHVRGFMEEGTTTTPFDMAVLNNISRYQLAMEAIRRSRYAGEQAVISLFEQKLNEHHRYIREHLEDMPEIKNWQWEAL